jgi:enoyl-CoA hydratase
MKNFQGTTLSWTANDGVVEIALHREPCNEIGFETLQDLEKLVAFLRQGEDELNVAILYSKQLQGFCAGADLRETFRLTQDVPREEKIAGVREFLTRIHAVMNAIDSSPLVTIAAVHGVCFGGGLELALTCDLIVADKMARFCFPELRLGLIPGFGGIPRLKRDLGNAVVRDLLLTGRSLNATKAQSVGLVSQVASEGESLRLARSTAEQIKKFDPRTRAAAKKFVKPIPEEELRREIEIFCELFTQPAVEAGLRKFVESTEALPYLP